jgi:hypothetical protein
LPLKEGQSCVAHVLLLRPRPSIIRSIRALISGGVSPPSSTQAALRPRGFLAVTIGAAGCSADRLSLSGFAFRPIERASACHFTTIAGTPSGTGFRFRGGRL